MKNPTPSDGNAACRLSRGGWLMAVALPWTSRALVRAIAFRDVQVGRFLLEGTPRVVGSMYRGSSVR